MRVSEFLVFVCAAVCCLQASYGAGHAPDEDLVFTCREGWTLYEGVCYLPVNVPMNYDDAFLMCWRQGGSMFQPINQQQFYSLKDMLPDIFWTAVYQKFNGDWELRQNRELFPLESFSLWANYQPMMNSEKFGCVSINKFDGGYVNVEDDCTYTMNNAVCQYDACLEGFVPCDNGRKCIKDPRDVCNDVDDCMDKSDERNCTNKCKNYLMLSQRSGHFSTGTIVDGKDCWWSMEAPIGERIKLYVPDMILETNVAHIEVWGGDPSIDISQNLERLTGSIPGHYVFSRNNFLHLRLSAGDLTRSISSMNFNWTTEIPGISREETVLAATDQYQELAFPISFDVYEDLGPYDLDLYWRITVPEGDIISYHLNCRRGGILDTPIKVRDGALESWQDTATGIYYITASNTLRVWMTYDSRIRPFTLSYRSGCHVSATGLSGKILSPGYSLRSIPHELQCEWTLTAGEMQDPPRGMSIKFLDIDLAVDPRQGTVTNTSMDMLQVEIDDNPMVLTPVEFDDKVANIIHAPGGRIKLTLQSDVTLNSAGFVAEFGIDCEPLELSAETDKSTDDRFIDEKVTLDCPDGYQFDLEKYKDEDEVVLTCGTAGFSIDDSFIIPECQVVQCGTPPKIANGYIVNSTKTSYEGKAWYSCTQGFGLTGNAMVQCNAEGKWTSPPICTSSQCPVSENQLTVNNGGYEVVAGNEIPDSADFAEFNVIVKFFCSPGYELIGQRQTHCTELGWDHDTPPTCQKLKCIVPEVENANITPTSETVEVDEDININCRPGYRGGGTVTCLANQTIDQETTCTNIDECTEESDTCDSDTTECIDTTGSFTCECKSGYRRINDNTCEDIRECDDNNGGCSDTCDELDGSYECSCPDGYALYSSNGLHGYDLPDGENGLLDGDLYRFNHTCVRIPCPALSAPSHGKHVFTREDHFITAYKLYCDDGYALWIDGTQQSFVSEVSCNGGIWTGSAECKARSCSAPSAPKYGSFDESGVDFQGAVTLTCNYTMSRQVTRKAYCIYDAGVMKLAGEKINECPVIDCQTPQLPLGGGYNGAAPLSTEHLDPGSMFSFQCGNGYDLSGQTSDSQDTTLVKCMENGRWDFGTIRCIGKQCPDPGTPVDATQIATSYEQGATLRYSCRRDGFKPLLDGQDRNYTCDYNPTADTARWSNNLSKSNLPTCTDVTSPVVVDSPEDKSLFPMDTVQGLKEPVFEDNFGIKSKVRTNYMESGDVILAEQQFGYTVTDFVGFSATDSFTYRILDRDTKPNLECPPQEDIPVSSDNDGTFLVQDMLEDYDNTSTLAVSPTTVESTRTNIGTAQIATATLTDQYGRMSSCTFMIHFTAGVCFEELLYPDSNAVRTCSETSSGLSCVSVCKANFIYKSGTKNKTFDCTGQNDWDLPSDLDIFCLPIENPAYLADVDLVYTSNGPVSSCLGPFQQTIQTHLANFEANIRGACNQMNWNVTVKTAGAVISIVQFDVTLQLNLIDTDTPTAARQACVDGLDAANADIFNVTGNIYPCSGRTLNPTAVDISDPDISCVTPSYQLQRDTEAGHVCVPCGPGYFYNSGVDECERCSSEQYQNLTNQMQCKTCQTATAPNVEKIDCKNTCPPGFFSSDGYYPCEPCGVDTFWNDPKTCLSCNGSSSTIELKGAKNENECYEPCPVGCYSKTGYSVNGDCSHCPVGFYQPTPGQTQCMECDGDQTTNGIQTVNEADCIDLSSCSDYDCDADGTDSCEYRFHRPVCICKSGFHGQKCQNKYEICDYNPCSEDSTCTPISGESNTDFTCTCRDDLDTCTMSVVRNNTVAINTTLQYQSNENSRDVCINSCEDDSRCQSAIFIFGFCYLYDRKLQDGQDLLNDNSVTSEYMEKNCIKVFGGDRCEEDLIDDCLTAGCAEGSMCMDEIADFTCLCPAEGGVKGELCSDAVDLCDPNPCDNGQCNVFGTVRYQCTCDDGYTGETCDTLIDQCEENVDVCLYGGTCTPSLGDYSCGCVAGFNGDNCQNTPNFCSQNDCLDNTCISRVDDQKGQCYCERPLFTQDGNFACNKSSEPCDLLACSNGGICTPNADGLMAYCECMAGWTGSTCQHNIDDCTDASCEYGVCNDLLDDFNCTCDEGYEGPQCKTNTDDCPGDCANGICEDGVDSYTCNCFSGYTGQNCEEEIDECNRHPCQHGGVCSEENPGSYSCSCETGWTGTNCETPVDSCEVSPCQNDGKCFTIVTDPVCRCEGGTQGRLCEEPSDLCEILSSADLCQNNGICRNMEGTATCRCKTEYSLDRCYFDDVQDNLSGGLSYFQSESGADMDFCKKECLQMENCDAVAIAFQFCFYYNATYLSPNRVEGSMLTNRICPTDYSGDSCQFVRDWCAEGVCKNGGTCTAVEPHGYQCQCPEGYSGVNCEIQANPCDSNPCGNSEATCRTSGSVTDYICQCPEGKVFTGSFCRAPAPVASLLVNTMEAEDTSCLNTPFYLNSNSLSVLIKMKVYASGDDPVYFSLVSGPVLHPMPDGQFNNFELKVKLDGIQAEFNGTSVAIPYGPVFGSTLFNGEWHDIGISINLEGEMRSVIDAIEASNTANIGKTINFDDNAQICLGESVLAEYANISVYDYVLTPQDFTLVVASKFNPTMNAVQNFWNYDLRPSTTRLSAPLQVSPYPDASAMPPAMDCSGIAETVEYVLEDRFISLGGLSGAETNIDTIKEKNTGLTVKHTLPDELVWGYYGGVVVGMDEHHNYGQCRFSVYIKYNDKCPAPIKQNNGLQYSTCANGDGVCSVSCSGGSDGVAAALPELVPCTKLGVYYTQSPHRDLILPGCNAKVSPKYVVSATMQFLFIIPCTAIPQIESVDQVLLEQFEQLDADKWTNICVNAQCSNIQFATASCDDFHNDRFNLEFEVQLDKDSLDYANGGSVYAAEAMRMILMLEKDLSLSRFGNAVLLTDTVEISQSEKCTTLGYAMLWEGSDKVCVPCGPGRHFEETVMGDDCLLCAIGYYQDEFAKMECKRCGNDSNGNPLTTYQLGATAGNQCAGVCSVGEFYNEVSRQCVKCARHYYQSESGQNHCEPCPVGYKTAINGSTSSTDCKEDCPAGKYRHAGTQVCLNCSRGQWRSLEFDDCQPCAPGKTTMIGELGTSVTSCSMDDCESGTYWNVTERKCVDCDFGHFQSEKAMLQCEKCSKNYTTTQMKSISSSNCTFYCSIGYEVVDGQTDTCRACSRGTYKDNVGTSKFDDCKDCTGGNTTDSTAAMSLKECFVPTCVKGQKVVNGRCDNCSKDTYSEVEEPYTYTECLPCTDDCEACGNLYGTSVTGASSPDQCMLYCAPGFELENGECQECKRGYIKDNADDASRFGKCIPCPSGRTTDDTGSTSSENNCTVPECEEGQIVDGSGCLDCLEDFFQDMETPYSYTNCTECPPIGIIPTGTRNTKSESETDCLPICEGGKQFNQNTMACDACPMGTFKPANLKFDNCSECDVKYTTSGTGADKEADCNIRNCQPGTFINETTDECDPCPYGQFQNEPRKLSCIPCGDNLWTQSEGSNSSDACQLYCNPGLHSTEVEGSDAKECTPCPEHYYKSDAGLSECKECSPNYTSNDNKTSCSEWYCYFGSQYNSANGGSCNECAQNFYKDTKGNTDICTECPAGYTTKGTGQRTCDQRHCVAGEYFDSNIGNCSLCAMGTFKSLAGNQACSKCADDKTTAGVGSKMETQCDISICPVGQFRVPTEKSCTDCPLNKFQNESGQTSCKDCNQGDITLATKSTQSSDCVPECQAGKQYNGTSKMCMDCPAGSYKETVGNAPGSCQPCPTNRTTIGPASTLASDCSQVVCGRGTYSDSSSGSIVCVPCAVGSYNSKTGQAACTLCLGQTTLGTGSDSVAKCVEKCTPGNGFNDALNNCQPCPQGQFNDGVQRCKACPQGFTNLGGGSTSCPSTVVDPPQLTGRINFSIKLRVQVRIDNCNSADFGVIIVNFRVSFVAHFQNTQQTSYGNSRNTICANPQCLNIQITLVPQSCNSSGRRRRATPHEIELNASFNNVSDTLIDNNDNEYPFAEAVSNVLATAGDALTPQYRVITEQGKSLVITTQDFEPGMIEYVSFSDPITTPLCNEGERLVQGVCEECPAGTYWSNEICIQCAVDTYQNQTGQTLCTDCPSNTFSDALGAPSMVVCKDFCTQNVLYCRNRGTCYTTGRRTARCECFDDFKGETCESKNEPSSNMPVILGAAIGGGGGLLIILLIVVGVYRYLSTADEDKRKRQRYAQDDEYTYDRHMYDNYAMTASSNQPRPIAPYPSVGYPALGYKPDTSFDDGMYSTVYKNRPSVNGDAGQDTFVWTA